MLTGHFEIIARDYAKDSIPSEIRQKLKEDIEEELAQYKALLDSNKISEDFYNLVSIDRSYFYAGAQSSIAFLNYLLEEREQNILNEEQYTGLWADAFQTAPVSEKLMRSPWFFYYVQSYLRFKESTDSDYDLQALSEIGKRGKIHTHNIEMAKKYLSGKILEYYYAAYILYEAINKNYEKELLALFEEFKNEYPSSPYTHFVESEIIPIYSFHEKQKEEMSETVRVMDGFETINSLQEAVGKLNAKKVYVDIWATWCGPCKKEFKYYPELHKLLKKEDITMLYISIDEDERAEKWREMMKYYQLDGYHIRANDSLMKNLRRLRGQDSFGIPWHMLTDGSGNILKKYVLGPSEIEMLKKQLQE
ncbi:redoxin family protein [Christiangramia antarctica]|uniref:Redoxin family protein n=2 Tax=Christiangramia TaxID=292691 RepID=A0ABW5X7Z2_9FLAO